MPSDHFFDLDLTNFEVNQRRAYDSATGQFDDDEDSGSSIEVTGRWQDLHEFDELYSPESIWKAKGLIEDGKVEELDPGKFAVQGNDTYVVHVLESGDQPVPWAICSCPNGSARGGRPSCYHTAAVLATVMHLDLSGYAEPPRKVRRRT